MSTYWVKCIVKKPNHKDPYTSIQAYGVTDDVKSDKSKERWPQAKMIEILEAGNTTVRSYGLNPATGKKEYADLEVVTHKNGTKYVKSKNDGDEPDNLLSQLECDGPKS